MVKTRETQASKQPRKRCDGHGYSFSDVSKGNVCLPVKFEISNDEGMFKSYSIFEKKPPSNFAKPQSIDFARRIDSFQKTFWSKGFDSVALHGDKQQLLAGSCFFWMASCCSFLSIYGIHLPIHHTLGFFGGISFATKQHASSGKNLTLV